MRMSCPHAPASLAPCKLPSALGGCKAEHHRQRAAHQRDNPPGLQKAQARNRGSIRWSCLRRQLWRQSHTAGADKLQSHTAAPDTAGASSTHCLQLQPVLPHTAHLSEQDDAARCGVHLASGAALQERRHLGSSKRRRSWGVAPAHSGHSNRVVLRGAVGQLRGAVGQLTALAGMLTHARSRCRSTGLAAALNLQPAPLACSAAL